MLSKVLVFVVLAIIVVVILVNNANGWSTRFHQYMLSQANKVFGRGAGWERPWAPLLSKAMVLFFGFMLIVLIYVVVFSV
jgi:preprotein translocase subunit SecG